MSQAAQVPGNLTRRRATERRRCLLASRIVFGPEGFTVEATIRDVSEGGARIRLGSQMPLPREFRVILRDGACLEAEIVWRRGAELGVRFLGPVDLTDPTDASVRALRHLWLEMAERGGG
jgi:hypothetical protein